MCVNCVVQSERPGLQDVFKRAPASRSGFVSKRITCVFAILACTGAAKSKLAAKPAAATPFRTLSCGLRLQSTRDCQLAVWLHLHALAEFCCISAAWTTCKRSSSPVCGSACALQGAHSGALVTGWLES